MTSKAVLKLAEELLDRAFREAEGQADRKVDLVLLVDGARSTVEKAEPAFDYLHSRGLIHPVSADGVYLTQRGVEVMATEQDIKTLPKFEQAWGGAPVRGVAEPAPSAVPRPYRPMLSFVDPSGGVRTFDLAWSATVGRSDEATLTLPDPRASKRHVEFKYAGNHYLVRDLGSANGTMVNGSYVETHELAHGDVLLIGRTEVTYSCPEVMPEPLGPPPADVAVSRTPAAGAPTARPDVATAKPEPARVAPVEIARITPVPPAHAEPARVASVAHEPARVAPAPHAEPARVAPVAHEPPRVAPAAHAEPARAPSPLASAELRRADPARGVRPVQTAPGRVPPAAVTPQPAAAPAATGRRRTAGTPAPSAEVPIVKGRPEAPPSAPVADDSGLFAARGPDATGGDLFGDAPTKPPARGPAAPATDLFADEATITAPGAPSPPAHPRAAPDLFAESAALAPSRAEPAPAPERARDLFAPTDPSPRATGDGDLFAPAAAARSAAAAPDLFAPPPTRGAPASTGADLFAPAPTARPPAGAPDPFASRDDQAGGDLFAPNYAAGSAPRAPVTAPDLFASGPIPTNEPPADTLLRGAVSPLPLGSAARAPEDLLPLEEDLPILEPEPVISLDTPVEDATLAGVSPLLARDAGTDAAAAASPLMPAADADPSGRTHELPAWGAADGAHSLAPFPSEPAPPEEPLTVGPPDAGGFDERTPVEETPAAAAPEQILAAAAELPEAPEQLEDGGAADPVAYAAFAETLLVLRARLADAGVPDQGRLVEAIELLRKHPSVRAALTDP